MNNQDPLKKEKSFKGATSRLGPPLVPPRTSTTGPSSEQGTSSEKHRKTAMKSVLPLANEFTFRLYLALRQDHQNLLVSPIDVLTMLAAVHCAAEGNTAKEMESALHLPANQQVNIEAFNEILTLIKTNEEGTTLINAKAMFVEKQLRVKEMIANTMEKFFDVKMQEVDFTEDADSARRDTNQWAREMAGEMQDIFRRGSFNTGTKAVLISASYFRAPWWRVFHAEDTTLQRFYLSPKSSVQVPMMEGIFLLKYTMIDTLDVKIVKLYYNPPQEELYALILLPNTQEGLENLEDKMKNGKVNLNDLTMTLRDVKLSLPRIKLESQLILKEVIQEFGVHDLFETTAQLTPLSDGNIYINQILQILSLSFEERGTDSNVTPGAYYHHPKERQAKVEFKCDHPFLFTINKENIIVFVGRVMNPSLT